MAALLKAVFDAIVPEAARLYVWRFGLTVAIALHVLWACGAFEQYGLPGFALSSVMAQENSQIKGRLTAIEAKQDIALRIALADEICRLYMLRDQSVANPPLWRTLNETFNARQEDYRAVNSGNEYAIAQCSAPR